MRIDKREIMKKSNMKNMLLGALFLGTLYSFTRAGLSFGKKSYTSHVYANIRQEFSKRLVFIPGFGGDSRRLEVIRSNLRFFDSTWDCLIFLYTDDATLSKQVQDRCTVIKYISGSWPTLLKQVRPEFIVRRRYQTVCVLLDDVLIESKYDIQSILNFMRAYSLDVASPRIRNSPHEIMNPTPHHHAEPLSGRLTNFVEIQFTFFSPLAWICFWDIIDIDNASGWGFDVCLFELCNLRIGIMATTTAVHKVELGSAISEDAGARDRQMQNWYSRRSRNQTIFQPKCSSFHVPPSHGRHVHPLTANELVF